MGQTTLVREQVDGGAKLLGRLRDRGFAATGACWGMADDDAQLYLYVVSPGVELTGTTAKYEQVHDALAAMAGEWSHPFERIDSGDIRVIAPSHPLAVGMSELYTRYPQLLPLWQGKYTLGRVFVEGLFVYPASLFAPLPVAAG